MCCGRFKNFLYKQNLINESCIKVSTFVQQTLESGLASEDTAKKYMHAELHREELKIKMFQHLILNHTQYDDRKLDAGL